MNRITYVEIAGKKYPLSFSLSALKEISNRFGGIEEMYAFLTEEKKSIEEVLEAISFMLSVMIKQGCAYMNLFLKDVPPVEGARYEGEYISLSKEEIDLAISAFDLEELIGTITECIGSSNARELKAESKNARAPKAD